MSTPKDDGGPVRRAMERAEHLRQLVDSLRFEEDNDVIALADEVKRLRAVIADWRMCAEKLRPFAICYSSHPQRNPADQLDAALALFDALATRKDPHV